MNNFTLSAFGDEIDSSLDIQLEVLNKHNIGFLEIRGVDGKNISNFTLEEAKLIKTKLDKYNIRVSAIGSPIGKISLDDNFEEHVDKFMNLLGIAKIMGTEYIRIFSFYYPSDIDMNVCKSEVIKRIRILTRMAEEAGIILLHENEKDIFGDIPERCLEIVESINSPNLRLIFDPANFIQSAVEPYPYAFKMLRQYVKYVHIKDALIADGSVVPSGYGDGRIEDILRDLKKSEFKGFLSIEPHLASFEGLENLERNIKIQKIKRNNIETFELAVNAINDILERI